MTVPFRISIKPSRSIRVFFRAFDNLGIAHSKKGEYDLAIEDFTQAIKLNRKYAGPFQGRGEAYAHKGEYDLAIPDFDQAIKLDPDYAEAFYNRGLAHFQMHRYDRAILGYEQAIKLRPDFAEAFYNLGYAHYQAHLPYRASRTLTGSSSSGRISPTPSKSAVLLNGRSAISKVPRMTPPGQSSFGDDAKATAIRCRH
jgi:tetratricopeptide (TPR) repeat protein